MAEDDEISIYDPRNTAGTNLGNLLYDSSTPSSTTAPDPTLVMLHGGAAELAAHDEKIAAGSASRTLVNKTANEIEMLEGVNRATATAIANLEAQRAKLLVSDPSSNLAGVASALEELNKNLADNRALQQEKRNKLSAEEKNMLSVAEDKNSTKAESDALAMEAANILAAEAAAMTQLSSSFSGQLEGAAGRKRLLAAQQCFLLYNNHFFVKRHRQLLSSNYPTQTSAARAKRPKTLRVGSRIWRIMATLAGNLRVQ